MIEYYLGGDMMPNYLRRVFIFAVIGLSFTFLTFCQEEDFFSDLKVNSASKFSQSISEVPSAVTIITKDDIQNFGFTTLAEILNFLSNGFYTLNDRRYEFAGERGMFAFEDYNTRFLLLIDGHILNEPSNNFAGVDRSTPIPIDLIDKIEIIYGPFGIMYGTSNLEGIINVITKSANTQNPVSLKLSAGPYSTSDAFFSSSYHTNLFGKDLDAIVSLSSYETDGKNSSMPFVKNENSNIIGGKWGDRADFERSPSFFSRVNIGDYAFECLWGYRKKGVPYAPWGDTYGVNSNYLKDERASYFLSYDHYFNQIVSTSLKIAYDDYTYEENDSYLDKDFNGIGDYFWHDTMKTRRVSGEGKILLDFSKSLYLFGGYWKRERLYQKVVSTPVNENVAPILERLESTNQRAYSLYSIGQWKMSEKLISSLAVSYVKYNYAKGETLYRGSIIFNPNKKNSLKLVVGEGFRVPAYYEYEYADSTSQLSNPTLHFEKSPSAEFTYLYYPSLMTSIEFSAFYQKINGFIEQKVIANPSEIQGDVIPQGKNPDDFIGFVQFQNGNDIKIKGASLSLRQFFSKGLALQTNISAQKVENEDGERLSGSPRIISNLGLSYSTSRVTVSLALSYLRGTLTSQGRKIEPYEIKNSFDGRFNLLFKDFPFRKTSLGLFVINPFNCNGYVPLSPAISWEKGKRYDRTFLISLKYGF